MRTPASLEAARDILLEADGFTLRDRPSIDRLRGLVPDDRLTQTADPVLSFLQPVARATPWPPDRRLRVGFNARQISSISPARPEEVGAEIAEALVSKLDADVRFLPMSASDPALGERIRARLPSVIAARFSVLPHRLDSPESHLALYRDVDLVVTMRLHTAVLASLLNVPVVALDCNAKIPGFVEELGLGPYVSRVSDGLRTYEADIDDILAKTSRLIDAWPSIREPTLAKVLELRRREAINMDQLQRTIADLRPREER